MKKRLGMAVVLIMAVIAWSGCPPSRCQGTDPKASRIDYTRLSLTTPTSGMVRITGVVINNGRSAYTSGEGQQSVVLFEGGTEVAREEFTNLAVDAAATVVFERMWSTQDEFRPPSYTVELAYDPDIYIDGNTANDDCNGRNNSFARTTAGLDDLFE